MRKLFTISLRSLWLLAITIFLMACSESRDEGYVNPIFIDSPNDLAGNLDSLRQVGIRNAVKKAYQMTDIVFTPRRTFKGHKTYSEGVNYKGMVYSSVKEINTFVGEDISFHTFMTAIHNPRSRIYTDEISKAPYHGKNAHSYYGTVCSGLVGYALGLEENYRSYDLSITEKMESIEPVADSIQIGDVIWQPGHVTLITDVERDGKGFVGRVEVSEAISSGARRYWKSAENVNASFGKGYRLLRYKEFEKNQYYQPQTSFVAVGDERLESFVYNDDICPDKGDKSCYRTDEPIVLNVSERTKEVEIFKDSHLYASLVPDGDHNVAIDGLKCGYYSARAISEGNVSDSVSWIVVDAEVRVDKNLNLVYFESSIAHPVYYEFCDVSGFRPENYKQIYTHVFTDDEIKNGYVRVSPPSNSADGKGRVYKYVKVHFECEYGRIINTPIDWFN